MSMSIFSSFDALCAESFFGQKVGFSWSSNNTNKQSPAGAAGKIDELKKGKDVIPSSSQPAKKPEDCRRIKAPRFAPELDGIHCFESILPY